MLDFPYLTLIEEYVELGGRGKLGMKFKSSQELGVAFNGGHG